MPARTLDKTRFVNMLLEPGFGDMGLNEGVERHTRHTTPAVKMMFLYILWSVFPFY